MHLSLLFLFHRISLTIDEQKFFLQYFLVHVFLVLALTALFSSREHLSLINLYFNSFAILEFFFIASPNDFYAYFHSQNFIFVNFYVSFQSLSWFRIKSIDMNLSYLILIFGLSLRM